MKIRVALLAGFLLAAADAQLTPVNERQYQDLVNRHHGEILVVDFWATWCPPCLEELPRLVALAGKYRSRGVRLITVSCDQEGQEPAARKLLDRVKAPRERYIRSTREDEAFINAVDANWSGALPGLFVYRLNSELAQSFIGEADLDEVAKLLNHLSSSPE